MHRNHGFVTGRSVGDADLIVSDDRRGAASSAGRRRPSRHAPISAGETLDSTMLTMYTYIVDRTQIYLTAEESAALERASIETGKTRSQLIREAIDEKYGSRRSLEEFMAVLDASFGAWKEEPGEDRSAYLKDLRRADLAKQRYLERLRRAAPASEE